MTGNAPGISVVIPCWNSGGWVGRCLAEVFAALPSDGEVIAVDDGSDDSTLEILKAAAATEPRLKVVARKHAGVSAARNAALDVARGTLVFFVDPDDGVEPDFFSAMRGRMDETGADCCVCAMRISREDGSSGVWTLKGDYESRTKDEVLAGYLPRIFGFSFDDIRSWYEGGHLFDRRELASSCRMAFRRRIIEENSLRFDERLELYEDAIFNSRYLAFAESMTCIDRPLYCVNERSTGAMATIPRDAARVCRNKLALIDARIAIATAVGGALMRCCEGSLALGAMEMLAASVRRLPRLDCFRMLMECLSRDEVRSALRRFPMSFRKPLVAVSALLLRLLALKDLCRRGKALG